MRAAERRQGEGERGEQAIGDSARMTAGWIGGRKRNRQDGGEAARRRRTESPRRAPPRPARPRGRRRGIRRARARRPSSRSRRCALRMASVARLRSTKPCAALATPTPPTTSDSSPASVRNSAKRSRSRLKSGETARRERASQPACGKAFLASARSACNRGFVRRAAGPAHHDPRRPANQRTRLDKPGRVERGLRDEDARPEADAERQADPVRSSATVADANFASPMRMTSPSFRPSRASSASSAAAPKTPSFPDKRLAAASTGPGAPRRAAATTARPP